MGRNDFIGEILHFGAVRFRVVGSGNLQSSLHSLDDETNETLSNIALSSGTGTEPTILASFVNQRAQLKVFTSEIDEYFSISKIIVFVRPIATGYPL